MIQRHRDVCASISCISLPPCPGVPTHQWSPSCSCIAHGSCSSQRKRPKWPAGHSGSSDAANLLLRALSPCTMTGCELRPTGVRRGSCWTRCILSRKSHWPATFRCRCATYATQMHAAVMRAHAPTDWHARAWLAHGCSATHVACVESLSCSHGYEVTRVV